MDNRIEQMINQKKISRKIGETVQKEFEKTGEDPEYIVNKLGLSHAVDTGEEYIERFLNSNREFIKEVILSETISGFGDPKQMFLKIMMQDSKGKIDPATAVEALTKLMDEINNE